MSSTMPAGAWIAIGILVLLTLVLGRRSSRPRQAKQLVPDDPAPRNMDALPLPVRTIHAKPLLSNWERAAIGTFARQLPRMHRICPQVRLLDMLSVEDGDRSRRQTTRNRLGSKSVDFAIIDPDGRVVLIIELNDSSHDRPERRDRDELVRIALDQACRSAPNKNDPHRRPRLALTHFRCCSVTTWRDVHDRIIPCLPGSVLHR